MTDASTARTARDRRVAAWSLAVYGIVLALIAFWPVPVDRGAESLLRDMTRAIPVLSHGVIEFCANVLLFAPLGVLLALTLRRRAWVMPIALIVTVAIEAGQALFLAERTPSLGDVVANLSGAGLGIAFVLVARRRRRPRAATRAPVVRESRGILPRSGG